MIQKAICIGKQDLDMQELYIYMTRSHMIWLKKGWPRPMSILPLLPRYNKSLKFHKATPASLP